jgi:hypothetical protein
LSSEPTESQPRLHASETATGIWGRNRLFRRRCYPDANYQATFAHFKVFMARTFFGQWFLALLG